MTNQVYSVTVTSPTTAPRYVVESDASDGNIFSNRHHINVEANIGIASAGDYELRFSLLDESDTVVHTETLDLPGLTAGSSTQNLSLDLPAGTVTLEVDQTYRARASLYKVLAGPIYLFQDSATEVTGQVYYHFTSTNAVDANRNVLAEITSTSYPRRYLLETDASKRTLPLNISVKLHRYDGWTLAVGSTEVNVRLEARLYEVGTNVEVTSVPAIAVHSVTVDSHDGGVLVKAPATLTTTLSVEIDPPTQLMSATKTYYAVVTVSDQGVAGGTYDAGETEQLANQRVLHFTGELQFGPVATEFTGLTGFPTAGGVVGTFINVTNLNATGGTVPTSAGYSFTTTAMGVHLYDDGHAECNTGSTSLTGPMPDTDTKAGLGIERGSITLNSGGAIADVTVTLPVGMGYTATTNEWLMQNKLTFASTTLNGQLDPVGTVTRGGTLHFVEETKPIRFEVSDVTWASATATFQFTEVMARSVRKVFDDALAATPNLKSPATMGKKRSNDSYYHALDGTVSNLSVSSGATNADARLTASLGMSASQFTTHFPYNVAMKWDTLGALGISADLINVSVSELTTANNVTVSYAQHSWESLADCGASKRFDTHRISPLSSKYFFTTDGGLHATDVAGADVVGNLLEWGHIDSLNKRAHGMLFQYFPDGNFLMTGTFLRGDQSSMSAEERAGVLHNTGFSPSNLAAPERPDSVAYATGDADYPGLNLRLTSNFDGVSYITGDLFQYFLKTRSKYYTRYAGVSGIHDAMPMTAPLPQLDLWGYDFSVSNFGLAFLGNVNVTSRFNGSIDLPQYTDIEIAFEEMTLTDLGAVDSAKLPATTPEKTLVHWSAIMQPLSLAFVPENGCDPTAGGYLTMGMSGYASHLDFPLSGTLGFLDTGAIIREVDAKPSSAPITSRFPLPASFTITGRQGSDYTLTPVQEAYLSHDTQTSSGDGFWNVYAALNVPFFSDLKTHLHLGTTEADTTSPIHMMGGWPSHGWEIFADDPFEVTNFDTSHLSFTGTSLDAYRHDGDSSAGLSYLPRAQKEWLAGALAFDYALNWDTTLRYFTAAEPAVNANLLVLQANHQLDYLGPDHADISFGIQYDGLPEMSLSNFVINELGDTSGMREAVKNAVDDAVFTALEDGIDEFADLVSDQAEDLTDQLLDAAIDTPLELFFDELKAELQNPAATPYADANALIAAWFGATGAPGPVPAFVLRSQLHSIGTTASASTSLLRNVDAKLAKVETLIDSIIGQVPNASMGVDSGILFEDAFGSRTVIQQLGSELISTLADLTVTPTIDSELGALLNEAAPAFDTITEVLTTLRDHVSEIRTQISGGLELAAEVNAVFAAHAATFQSIADSVAASTQELVAELDSQDYAYLDGMEAELKARIRQEIEAELNASDMIAEVRDLLRDRLNDLHRAFESAVDSVFAELNKAIRDIATRALAGVDDSINGLLGNIGDSIGAGSITGFASINNDSLDMLRLDGHFEWMLAEEKQQFDAYLEILNLQTQGPAGCSTSAADTYQVTLGAPNTKLNWRGVDLQVGLEGKFNVGSSGGLPLPLGVGGSFELKSGSLEFEGMGVEELAAATMFSLKGDLSGVEEAYLAAAASLNFSGSGIAGGLFAGRSCSLDPILLIDEDVGAVLGTPPFTGGYVYGEGTFPLVDFGCVFNISCSAGAGLFYFAEGPTYGGKIHAGVSGEALCIVSVKGEVDLVGVKSGDDFRFTGAGKISGKVGACPFCTKFSKSVRLTYQDGSWDADY